MPTYVCAHDHVVQVRLHHLKDANGSRRVEHLRQQSSQQESDLFRGFHHLHSVYVRPISHSAAAKGVVRCFDDNGAQQ